LLCKNHRRKKYPSSCHIRLVHTSTNKCSNTCIRKVPNYRPDYEAFSKLRRRAVFAVRVLRCHIVQKAMMLSSLKLLMNTLETVFCRRGCLIENPRQLNDEYNSPPSPYPEPRGVFPPRLFWPRCFFQKIPTLMRFSRILIWSVFKSSGAPAILSHFSYFLLSLAAFLLGEAGNKC
jgi:hypothetical protein